MPLNKRLAIAMELNDGQIPFISQKAIKHVLVGVEKLVKAYEEQEQQIQKGTCMANIIEVINSERIKCGLSVSSELITDEEIINKDAEIAEIVRTDTDNILKHLEDEQQQLAELLEVILEETHSIGIFLKAPKSSYLPFQALLNCSLNFLIRDQSVHSKMAPLRPKIEALLKRISETCDYLEINVAAFRKLIKRHDKNVPKHLQYTGEFGDHSRLLGTQLSALLDIAASVRNAQEDFWERSQLHYVQIQPLVVL